MKKDGPVALVILDGFGYSTEKKYNAIAYADMPNFNEWWQRYPHSIIEAAGRAVGLPNNLSGNSEVGHLTLGAGRIIDQPMSVWLKSIEDGSFFHNQTMQAEFKRLLDAGGSLHIMGLLSDAGVHAHEKQIYASIKAAIDAGIKKIIVHAFLDGRDVAPRSAYGYLERLTDYIKQYNNYENVHVELGSLHGRFYAMDRDNNWDRIEKSYRVLTEKQDEFYESWQKILETSYLHDITDEFVVPIQLSSEGQIHNGDGILFCNIRPDRARELTRCFLEPEMKEEFTPFVLKPLQLTFFMTPVAYDMHYPTTVLFPRTPLSHTLKDVLADNGKTIFTVAETEKYAHVTYFFRGENEDAVATEKRTMIPSIVAQNYTHNPCMSASEITDTVINALQDNHYDFYLINYANADMVGHSGDLQATVSAVECLDQQLKRLYDLLVCQMGGTLYITADHGKAEQMYDEEMGQARTGHTNNAVPFIMIQKGTECCHGALPLITLSQVAPFILQHMNIDVPQEMK